MSKRFEDLLTAYMVARDHVETENRKYGLFEEKPTLDVAIQERREARQKLLAYVAELEAERRWIPVDENPAVSGIYLVQNIYDDIYPVKFDAKTETWELQNYDTIIHWTNIPELPEAER